MLTHLLACLLQFIQLLSLLWQYFNYGLSEEDWLEYSQQQQLIRQELTDAHRQNRPPDPAIVPIQPRRTTMDENAVVEAKPQAEATPTNTETADGGSEESNNSGTANDATPSTTAGPSSKPSGVDNEDETAGASPNVEEPSAFMAPQKLQAAPIHVSADLGGAWGAGAAPGSVLAKLIEEQEKQQEQQQQQDSSRRSATAALTSPTRRDSLGGASTTSYGNSNASDAGGGYYSGNRSEEPPQHDSSSSSYYSNKPAAQPPPPPPPEEDYYRGGRGWQQPQPPQQQPHYGDQQQHYDSYYPPQPPQNSYQQQQPYYGRGRGGGYRGRGGEGSRGYQPQQGGGRGYDPRKRPREDPRWSRR